ncbi:MAG: hypothetical protein AAGI23_22525 [Bacteroidota bacterium]
MKHLVTVLGFILSFTTAFSQWDSKIWTATDTISTDVYEFQVPASWRNLNEMLGGGLGPEQYFEASGQGLPISFNRGPVQVTIFLVKLNNSDLGAAKMDVIEGYFSNEDRVFKKKKHYDEETIILADSSEAVLLNTRFYRKSKGLNQSRYDLVTYSGKHGVAYMFTVSIQYVDKKYKFEKNNELKEYARKLYSTFRWK